MKRFAVGSAFSLRGRQFQGLSGFEGKPFHPPLTDVPVGAYVMAPIFDVISYIGRDRPWGRDLFIAASYTLAAGAIVSLLAALTGLADWLRMRRGSEVRRIANTHALIMVLVTGLVTADLAVRYYGTDEVTTPLVLALSLAILALVILGAAIGGSLVFDKGYKVRLRHVSAPPPSESMERE